MRIWLVQTGEEMPSDGEDIRLLRTCLLARELAGRGHDVVYCNSTFSHQKKVQRFASTTELAQPDGYRGVFLYGQPYSSNIGLRRIFSHRDNAKAFLSWARKEPLPDVIHCGLPPIELAEAASTFAKHADLASTVDCRDIWPEIIADRLSGPARFFASPVLGAWDRAKRRALSAATAVTGVSDGFVDWGVQSAGRQRQEIDRTFHLATPPEPVPADRLEEGRQYWNGVLGAPMDGELVIAYAGTFSRRFDLGAVLDGADQLNPEERRRIRIVLCGSGDMMAEIQLRAAANEAVVHGGWRSRAELLALMERASVGLLPYPNSRDFLITYPNKVGEYLTSGLPILTGTRGAIEHLLAPLDLRIGYEAGDPEDIARTLRSLLVRRDLPQLRAAARELAKDQFDPASIYPRFADWIEDVARRGRA
ncbi:MAG: glycosyltransferase [Croceibacterium sp.]